MMEPSRQRNPVRLVTVKRADKAADGTGQILGPGDAATTLRKLIGNKDREHFVVLHLDSRNQILSAEITGVGILTACLVHPREVFKAAILSSAAAIICGHNHPSGNSEPSKEDTELLKRLRKAGELMGIEILDFIIVTATEGQHWSARERGMFEAARWKPDLPISG